MRKKLLLIFIVVISLCSILTNYCMAEYIYNENDFDDDTELFIGYEEDTTSLMLENDENYLTNSQIIIEDDADLLTDSEEKGLYEMMVPITEYGTVLFKTINYNSTTTQQYAANYYHQKIGSSSGTLFLIDMAKRYIYIFSDGDIYDVIDSQKAEIITDNVYKYASNSDYYGCAVEAFDEILTVLRGEKIAEPMKYISNVIIAIMISLLTNYLIFMNATRIKAPSKKESTENLEGYFKYTTPIVTHAGQRREYSPQSDSSSGGGSSGGGGGSSGGGGGHSF